MLRVQRRLLSSAVPKSGAFLVTGGGSGLGEAVARQLVADGYGVVICDLKDSSQLASSIGMQKDGVGGVLSAEQGPPSPSPTYPTRRRSRMP
jgi:NAD(P)-dependent dehydrogenase (short-subunit alcohol dehydrogenase family)